MKNLIENLNKAFDNRVRLGIMSLLMLESWVDFSEFKEQMALTDGNLASHMAALEKENYIRIRKAFIGKKPNTSFQATEEGRQAFKLHLDALEALINSEK